MPAVMWVMVGLRYDPLFLSDEPGNTFGEASAEENGRVSHQGRELRALGQSLGAG
jgi:inosine/xanthosine triphosphate pyrophosphatase family protein